jgi:hypothetical protein
MVSKFTREKLQQLLQSQAKETIDGKDGNTEGQSQTEHDPRAFDDFGSGWPGDFCHFRADVGEIGNDLIEHNLCLLRRSSVWHGRRDSNPQQPVLETGTLPLSYCRKRLPQR